VLVSVPFSQPVLDAGTYTFPSSWSLQRVMDLLASGELGDPVFCSAPLRGFGYPSRLDFVRGGEVVCHVLYGEALPVLVVVVGRNSPVVDALVCSVPGVSSSRKDSALDVADPDYFEIICKAAISLANSRGMRLDCRGDWFTPGSRRGRTLYVGSRQSECFLRIYEHFKYHGYGAAVRVELEHKPRGREAKLALAAVGAAELFSRSRFAVDFLALLGADVRAFVSRAVTRVVVSVARAVRSMVRQYGRTLDVLIAFAGGDLGAALESVLTVRDELLHHRESLRCTS
jgi:hypothetical protein